MTIKMQIKDKPKYQSEHPCLHFWEIPGMEGKTVCDITGNACDNPYCPTYKPMPEDADD
jgi:hypothetical protein